MRATTIDEVIELLEEIIEESKATNNTSGYFAALYQKVTIAVKEKLNTDYFDNDQRMELLDIQFANRYFEAHFDYKNGKVVTQSWEKAFTHSTDNKLIVLQHLLLGINAHINLDLGIAAENTSDGDITVLHDDFNRINEILANMVDEIQQDLARIWSPLVKLLKWLKNIDNLLIDFSMNRARDGAWKFATELANCMHDDKENLILKRDSKIANFAQSIIPASLIIRLVFWFVRIGERGTTLSRIKALEKR